MIHNTITTSENILLQYIENLGVDFTPYGHRHHVKKINLYKKEKTRITM